MTKKTKPTIEEMERLEGYLACRCEICDAIVMIDQLTNSLDLMILIGADGEWRDASEGGKILRDFLTERHLRIDFDLDVEKAQSIVDYKREVEMRERSEGEIPF